MTVSNWLMGACRVLEEVRWYSRLRLGGVVPQGDVLALDFVETLLTEVVPVSKKPIFWWTTPFAISTANHREGTRKQPPIRAGQDRAGQAGGERARTRTGWGRGQGGSSPGGSSQSRCRERGEGREGLRGRAFWFLHVNFGVDDWSHQSRPMQTWQALKERERGGGKGGRRGRGGHIEIKNK